MCVWLISEAFHACNVALHFLECIKLFKINSNKTFEIAKFEIKYFEEEMFELFSIEYSISFFSVPSLQLRMLVTKTQKDSLHFMNVINHQTSVIKIKASIGFYCCNLSYLADSNIRSSVQNHETFQWQNYN